VVIGSGPGGYVASIKAAQLGMKVANIALSLLVYSLTLRFVMASPDRQTNKALIK